MLGPHMAVREQFGVHHGKLERVDRSDLRWRAVRQVGLSGGVHAVFFDRLIRRL